MEQEPKDKTVRLCWKAARGLLRTGEGIGVPANLSALGESAICQGCGKRAFFGGEGSGEGSKVFTPPKGCIGPDDELATTAVVDPAATVPQPRSGI